jgi:hypothetical protein
VLDATDAPSVSGQRRAGQRITRSNAGPATVQPI